MTGVPAVMYKPAQQYNDLPTVCPCPRWLRPSILADANDNLAAAGSAWVPELPPRSVPAPIVTPWEIRPSTILGPGQRVEIYAFVHYRGAITQIGPRRMRLRLRCNPVGHHIVDHLGNLSIENTSRFKPRVRAFSNA